MDITAKESCRICLTAMVLVLLGSLSARAAPSIDVEVAMERGLPLTAPQEWAKLLGQMDLASVRLRGARSGDQPEITSRKLGTKTRWKLLAVLNRRNELVTPHGKFRATDSSRLRSYFQTLPQKATQVDVGRFGLTEKQFRLVHADLVQTISFSTIEMTTREFLRKIEPKLTLPFQWDAGAQAALRRGKPLVCELRGMTYGTAMAMALRQHGLVLRPQQEADLLSLHIAPFDAQQESWPVGWKSEASPRQIAPAMYISLPIEISGFTLSQALDALKPRMKIDFFYDTWILHRNKIQPEKVQVKLARKKTYLKKAIDRILSQGRLAGELRVDESGRPFLWITRFGRDSPRASK